MSTVHIANHYYFFKHLRKSGVLRRLLKGAAQLRSLPAQSRSITLQNNIALFSFDTPTTKAALTAPTALWSRRASSPNQPLAARVEIRFDGVNIRSDIGIVRETTHGRAIGPASSENDSSESRIGDGPIDE